MIICSGYSEGMEILISFFASTFKNTKKVIEENEDYFGELTSIDQIVVLGHSFSDVDRPYFELIKKSISEGTEWQITYHTKSDLEEQSKVMDQLGVKSNKIHHIKMFDLLLKGRQIQLL